ncbi:MAG: NfeD family protein [Gemmatimonadota bacterium]
MFWLLPIGAAGTIYAAVVAISLAVYWLMMKAMRRPVVMGIETMQHAVGVVRYIEGRKATIWARSELWSAEPEGENLRVGDEVEVVGANGIVLKVRKAGARAVSPALPVSGGERVMTSCPGHRA